MNGQLKSVLERVRTWPESRQQDAARILEAMEQSGASLYTLTEAERAAVQMGLDQANRGAFCF